MDHPQKEHPFDWNAKLIRSFLHNPRLVWLILIAILVGGYFSLVNLRREGFPAISPKVVLVQTVFPGATSDEVERQVTTVIEDAVKDVKGLKETSSTSANSFSNVVVRLNESVTLETAIQDVQSKVQSARNLLPPDAEQPKVQTFSTGGASFILGITSSTGSRDEIHRSAEQVIKELSDVAGVKSARLFNGVEDRITVNFRPVDLAANGVALETVQLVLQGANVNFPVASLPVEGRVLSVVTHGAFANLEEIRNLLVGVNPQSKLLIHLGDVAEVRRGYDDATAIERFGYHQNGKFLAAQGVLVAVDITGEADIIRTKKALDDHLRQQQEAGRLPAGLSVVTLDDQAKSTQDQINEIVSGAVGSAGNAYLLGGFQLLFVAMLLFVNWRAALVAALAIPISLLFTFLTLGLLGIQLNTIVLFSLILVLGLIVDPAIVMVEAIQRYRDLKYGKNDAVLESGRRYGASLFMAVLTSVIVFLPFGVVSGIFGQIIKYIPLTVVPALFASYLVPVALLPLFSKWILKMHKPAHQADGIAHEVAGLSRAAEWFMAVNRNILGKKWKQILTLVAGLVLVGASLTLVATGQVQTVQFSRPKDNPAISVSATFAKGLTFDERDALARRIEALLLGEKGIDHFYYYQQNRDELFLFGLLKEKVERSAANGSKNIVARLKTGIKSVPSLTDAVVNEVGTGTPESDYQISAQLYDSDPAVLELAAQDVGSFLSQQDRVSKVDDGFTDRGDPELKLVLDRTKVQAAGLSSFEVGQQLKTVLDQTQVTKYAGEGGAADVFLVNASKPKTIEAIKNLPLVSRNGQLVRLGDVATIDQGLAVDAIQKFDGQRFVNVKARVDGSNSEVFAVQKKLNNYLTPAKLKELGIDSNESRGDFDDIAKSFRELGLALVIALLLTYIVLVLQFRSFSQPLIMLVTVPLSFIGVFPALWLSGSDLGFLELLGVTILVGIVENVAIFLMDYANQLVNEQGMSPKDAIIQATGVRFRPILLTKLVALGGLLPLAIESEFWRGLSVTIMAGIGLSGFLSLIVIPILYVWIEGGRKRFHGRLTPKISS